ncbi:T9SS type A sorting domain-containing protein [bacterium]|nr:T9SS type A sorting domain-containing protein [bacterium]
MTRFLPLLLLAAFSLQAEELVKVTRDPRPNPDYVSYAEWRAENPLMGALKTGPVIVRKAASARTEALADKGLVALVVAEYLKLPLKDDIDQWIYDAEARGFIIEMSNYSNEGTVEDLKKYLKTLRTEGLVGAVLVGNLPAAWFQVCDDWGADGGFNPPDDWYEEFPTDLFLADLDGKWEDDSLHVGDASNPMTEGTDGIYDSHSGNKGADIWVSRIDASHIKLEEEIALYHEYFSRVHKYRQAELTYPSKGYFYIDNDWRDGFYDNKMTLVCDVVDEIRDTNLTCATDYKNRLAEDGLFMAVCVHSSPDAHYFVAPNNPDYDMLQSWLLPSLAPKYGFYNLFACSNCRWVEKNCMGSMYHFFGSGLASIGSTKTGSMLNFDVFNSVLGSGATWGDAWRELTNFWISDNDYYPKVQWARSWFMGLCILGDGTLDMKEQKPVAIAEAPLNQPISLEVTPFAREAVELRFSLSNESLVRIDIYDASGRLVAGLSNGIMGSGTHMFAWRPDNASQGVYFARLDANGQSAVRKITIIR